MTVFLVSPAEPPSIKVLGNTSDLVETYGADILWADQKMGGFIGVQRKFYTDLLASIQDDDRLHRETAQLPRCKMAFLVVEGRPHWTVEGTLNDRFYGRWTRDGYRSLLREVQTKGIYVEYTDDEEDTVRYVRSLAKWIAKGEHHALDRRPKPGPDKWGHRSNRATQLHVLQGIDDIGPIQAGAIIDHCGGELPLRWTLTEKEMLGIKGIGKGKVKKMVTAIAPRDAVDTPWVVS